MRKSAVGAMLPLLRWWTNAEITPFSAIAEERSSRPYRDRN
jgi:hypothetical protein